MALSPMMQQYMDVKKDYEDAILLFRLGDFYEMFFDDALTASKELDLTLTGRNCGMEERAPMCGVPFHSSEEYIARLVEKGYKVAICEQIEDDAQTKGIVKREVVQIITPGTVLSDRGLKDAENNFLASIYAVENAIGIAFCDISTGELECSYISDDIENSLINELVRISPKEIIINKLANNYIDIEKIKLHINVYINILEEAYYGKDSILSIIKSQLKGFSIDENMNEERELTMALGAILMYLFDTQKRDLLNINSANKYVIGSSMVLDKSTIRNLELVETLSEKKTYGSLLWVLDKTKTAMGGRKIKKWIKEPLNNIDEISRRHEAVWELVDNYMLRNHITELLKPIYDFERITGKIAYGTANGKDLTALRISLSYLPDLKWELEDSSSELLKTIGLEIDTLADIRSLLENALVEDPPFSLREGKMIKDGFDDELDELKNSIKDAKKWISDLEQMERQKTGIPNLKVGYNRVFGYYIDVTKSHFDKVPSHYIRKQTLANSERYITTELKETETLVLNAEEKINSKEYEIFINLRDRVKERIGSILSTSQRVSDVDVLTSFANVSAANGYVMPHMTLDDEIIIQKARHPVIEKIIKDGIFVPNDVYINRDDASMLLITGPNMAGKSTYMRQTALVVLMAQAGCFVPCEKAKIGIVDRIFTRIGASDNLISGQSTFYVEMNELSYILNNQTGKSLVILDEIGRGTSTYDGLSIAWATAEFLCKGDRKVRTLFASHYHELTVLENELSGFKNLTVDVLEENGEIVFLHKIIEGSASKSYGIHVAKLAGAPSELLNRAAEKLEELEKNQRKFFNFDGEQIKFTF